MAQGDINGDDMKWRHYLPERPPRPFSDFRQASGEMLASLLPFHCLLIYFSMSIGIRYHCIAEIGLIAGVRRSRVIPMISVVAVVQNAVMILSDFRYGI